MTVLSSNNAKVSDWYWTSLLGMVAAATCHGMQSPVQADRYVEVGGMPARAADGLKVPAAWLKVAILCLGMFRCIVCPPLGFWLPA